MTNPSDRLVLVDPTGRPFSDEERGMSLQELTQIWKTGNDLGSGKVVATSRTSFEKQSWVYACVNALARTIAQNPLRVRRPGEKKPVKKGEMTPKEQRAVALLGRPSKRKTGYDLWYVSEAAADTAGRAFWFLDKAGPRSSLPERIIPLNPDKVTISVSSDGFDTKSYTYERPDGSKMYIPEWRIIEFGPPNPYDGVAGLAPLSAALSAVELDMRAEAYNKKFYENGAQPGGILTSKKTLGKRQADAVRSEFEGRHRGTGASHKTAILSGDWDYKQLGLGQREMEFLQQRKFSREQIGAVFGVPGVLTNDPNKSNYSTANVELRIFADTNWVPKIHYYEQVLQAQYFERFAPDLEPFFDLSEAPGLREDISDKIDRALKLNRMGTPYNEAKEFVGLELQDTSWGATWWVNSSLVPADKQAELVDKELQDEPEVEVEPEEENVPERLLDEDRQAYWDSIRAQFTDSEAALKTVFPDAVSARFAAPDQPDEIFIDRVMDGCVVLAQRASRSVFLDLGVEYRDDIVEAIATRSLEQARPHVEKAAGKLFEDSETEKQCLNQTRRFCRVVSLAVINEARMASMTALGIRNHEWFMCRDQTGVKHVARHFIDGERAEIGREFSIGVVYPHADNHDDSCRCITVPVVGSGVSNGKV